MLLFYESTNKKKCKFKAKVTKKIKKVRKIPFFKAFKPLISP